MIKLQKLSGLEIGNFMYFNSLFDKIKFVLSLIQIYILIFINKLI